MADNVPITAGSGTSIAADDISSVWYQRFKLIHGADGVNAGDVSTANGLPVAGAGFDVAVTITRPSDTTAYASGDAISDSTSAPTTGGFTVTGASRASGSVGALTGLRITSTNPGTLQGEVWIFDQAVTAVNDNSAISLSDGDIANLVAVVPFLMTQETNNSWADITGLFKVFTPSGSANLRFLIKAKAAYTPANAEVFKLRFTGLYIS